MVSKIDRPYTMVWNVVPFFPFFKNIFQERRCSCTQVQYLIGVQYAYLFCTRRLMCLTLFRLNLDQICLGCNVPNWSASGVPTSHFRETEIYVGDRFHAENYPHKPPLSTHHNIRLCVHEKSVKTSYQESENRHKTFFRLRSSTMQSFSVHFVNYIMYNYIMYNYRL